MPRFARIISLVLFACLAVSAQSLDAPASVQGGATFNVTWSGTDAARDYVSIAEKGAASRSYISYRYLSKGQTLEMLAPEAAGVYELRWVQGKTREILVTRLLTVTAAKITLNAPASVQLGGDVEVSWSGTVNPRDFITIVEPSAKERTYKSYVYTKTNNSGKLRAPEKPGKYEVRYLSGAKYLTLAKVPITVGGVDASITIPGQVVAGAPFEIVWAGPDNARDYITIVEAGANEKTYKTYVYTSKGSPVTMRAPDKPGRYEVRYLTGRSYLTLASASLVVGGTNATLDTPDTVQGGTEFTVSWTGPNNPGDYVTLVKAGTPERRWGVYEYVHQGPQLTLRAPFESGDYELRYLTGQSYLTLVRRPIRLGPAERPPGFLEVHASSAGPQGVLPVAGGAVEVILDASGSMLQRQGGKRRIDIAKQVLSELIRETIPAGTPFALRVFGHREVDSCRTDLELPLKPLNAAEAAGLIGNIQAMNKAKTPIAKSIEAVARDLQAAGGQRVVVLVTDGEETCDGDPAEAIGLLKQARVDVRVNIVGFAIEDDELKQKFRHWSNIGEGEYFDAGSAEQLSRSLSKAVKAPFDVYGADGQQVASGLVGGDRVELAPGTYSVSTRTRPPLQKAEVVIASEQATTVVLEN